MRKTRLVILPGVRSLKTIGCLLLFLACPTIAFKGQENREVEPLCKAQDIKEFWEQESPWPGDLGGMMARTTALGPRPRLDTLTKHICNVDLSNRKVRETQRTLERRIVPETREVVRRLDRSIVSRSRSQENLLGSRRLDHRRDERMAEARAEMNRYSDRRQPDERMALTYRADTRVVNTRERITEVTGSRRDLNRMTRSNTRSANREVRSEDRERRVGDDNVRQRLSLPARRSELRENVRNTRRVGDVRDTRRESNSESRLDKMRFRQEATLSHQREVPRTVRERINGGVRRTEDSRRERTVNNRKDVRREVRMDDMRDSRKVSRSTRSIEDVGRNNERVRVDASDMATRQTASRRSEDSRRETTHVEKRTNRIYSNRVDVRRRQIDTTITRSLEDVERSGRRVRVIATENKQNSENGIENRSVERDMQTRNSISTSMRTRDARNQMRDSRGSSSSRLTEEIRRLDKTAQRAASDDNRVRHVESIRTGDNRREIRSLERIQDTVDAMNYDIRDSRILTRSVQSSQNIRRSHTRGPSPSRRGIENQQQKTINAESKIMHDDVRDHSRRPRSVYRDEMDSRRTSSIRLNDSRDFRRSTRDVGQTRQISQEVRGNIEQRTMQRSPMVQRATDSTRIIRSEGTRSQLFAANGFKEREEREISRKERNMREGEMKRETRSLKKHGNGYRVVDETDLRTERVERFSVANYARSEDNLSRLERQTRIGSHDRETRHVDNRLAREHRIELRSVKSDSRFMGRRMDARSSSVESRDSRAGNPVRLSARNSRSVEDIRRVEREERVVSNVRDRRRVDFSRNDQTQSTVMSRVDDMRRSDERVESKRNDRQIRRLVSRRSDENYRREVRSMEREMRSVEGVTRRRMSLDNRSLRLVPARTAEETRQSERRAKFGDVDRETRRLEERRTTETRREVRNLAASMSHMEERRTEMRRIKIDARSTESMRRSAQHSNADRDVSRVKNVRLADDRREREIGRVDGAAYSRLNPIPIAREETRRTVSRQDERRNVIRIVREMKSFDGTRAETRKVSRTMRSIEDTARINPKIVEIRQVHKETPRTRDVRSAGITETRDIYNPEIKLTRILNPDSRDRRTFATERATHKRSTLTHEAGLNGIRTQKMGYYEATISVVGNWLATFDVKMTDVSRLGETMMFGGIACYALLANVNKKAIF